MCRYRWYYHGTCHHLVAGAVVEICGKAEVPCPPFPRCLRRTTSLPDFYEQDYDNISPQQEMPAPPLFSPNGFRQWMAGPGTQTATSSAQSSPSLRRREEGIRGTDESSSLHNDEAILQHIAQHSRSPDDHHVGTDGRRMTSHGSTTVASDSAASPNSADFDTIEAEIDTIKAEVQHMRAEAENKQKPGEPSMSQQQSDLPLRMASSKIPGPVGSRHTNPLRIDDDKNVGVSPQKSLSSLTSAKRYHARNTVSKTRSSAASVVSPVSGTSAESFDACSQGLSSAMYYDAVEKLQSPASHRSSPHFAQLTKAASRRVNETLRIDSPPVKSGPESYPGKSTKAKALNFETAKRAAQHNQKRKSLPEGWMSQEPSSPADKELQKKEQVTPGSSTSLVQAELSPIGSGLRKKTSSYMSPTKSAQNRSIVTTGEEKQAIRPPRVKAAGLRVDTHFANTGTILSSPSSRVRADSSSVLSDTPEGYVRNHVSPRLKYIKAKSVTSEQSIPSAKERCKSVFMRLPSPLPHVANTIVTQRDSVDNVLDLIKGQLGKEDLLRRDKVDESIEPQSPPAARGFHNKVLAPLVARVNRSANGQALQPTQQLSTRDPDNEPMSRLISGLRGQSSAEIGRFLAGGQQETSGAAVAHVTRTSQLDASTVHSQIRKRSGDPAIIYKGRKPSTSEELPRDPAIIFASHPGNPGVRGFSAAQRKLSQPSSLRATATDFVPGFISDHPKPIKAPMWEPERKDSVHPQGMDLFYDDSDKENSGSSGDIGLPQICLRSLYDNWPSHDIEDRQEDIMPMSVPQFGFNRHFDLIHGDTGTSDSSGFSPVSTDSLSPWSTEHLQWLQQNHDRWEIMGKGRRKYQWRGGDGLEITFKGVGPDAEHDPNSPVLYRNYRANTKTLHMDAATCPRVHNLGSPLPPNAPRLMRERAEKMAFPHVPCTDMHWRGQYDVEPVVVPVAGLCAPCNAGDSALARIGGGIDLLSGRF